MSSLSSKYEWFFKYIDNATTNEDIAALKNRVTNGFNNNKINEEEKKFLLVWINNKYQLLNFNTLW